MGAIDHIRIRLECRIIPCQGLVFNDPRSVTGHPHDTVSNPVPATKRNPLLTRPKSQVGSGFFHACATYAQLARGECERSSGRLARSLSHRIALHASSVATPCLRAPGGPSRRVVRERGPDSLRAAQVVALRGSVQSLQFLRSQSHRNHLRRLGPTPGTATAATLQFGDVVASFSFVGPLPDLFLTHHKEIV